METELIIFLLVGGLSIFAAVMMLISENPVHSALFLILNFASVAFLFLMLEAEFLALVQITVYAGAIMVLFLFVIMLLGADRLLPTPSQRYNWLIYPAVGVVTAILLIASIAILEGEINEFEPRPSDPMVRVVQTNSNFDTVDVYLDNMLFAEQLSFGELSEFEEVHAGNYMVRYFEHESDIETATPLLEEALVLEENINITLVTLPEAIDGSSLLPVETDLFATDEYGTSRFTVIHAAACPEACPLDIADITDSARAPYVFVEGLTYGSVADVETLYRDRYNNQQFEVAGYEVGLIEAAQQGEEDTSKDVPYVVHQSPFEVENNHDILWVITGTGDENQYRFRGMFEDVPNDPVFGGATSIGYSLYIRYVLAFEVIALLLLAAMIGVIVLTKEADIIQPKRKVRRMAAVPGAPTVDEYLDAVHHGRPLPPPSTAPQLPESTGD